MFKNILPKETNLLRELYRAMLLVNDEVPRDVDVYCVDQNRGRARLQTREISVPLRVLEQEYKDFASRTRYKGKVIQYLAHELAHIAVVDMCEALQEPYPSDGHGEMFQLLLQKICPEEYQHWELAYKMKQAIAAGVSVSGLKDF